MSQVLGVVIGIIVGSVMADATANGAFGPADTGLLAQLIIGVISGAIGFVVGMWVVEVIAEGGREAWIGVGVGLAGVAVVVYLAIPPSKEELALECLDTEFDLARGDDAHIEPWVEGVEALGITWHEYECLGDRGGYLGGTDPSGDGEALLDFFAGNVGSYFDRDFRIWILFQCNGPLVGQADTFVRACLEALGDQEYLEVFDEHVQAVAGSGEAVEVRLESGSRFRHMDTRVRISSDGVVVRHDG